MSHSLDGLCAISLTSHRDDDARYVSGSRGEAIATLLQAIRDREVLLVLTGIAGVGKSAVLRAALSALAGEPIRVIRLGNPDGQCWTLRALVGQILGRPIEVLTETEVAAAFAALTAAPACEAQVVVAVDDAQTLSHQARDYLLLLSSLARSGGPRLQLILVGRGGHREPHMCSELSAIRGRTAIRVMLEPFADAEARDYLAFRLERIGGAIDEVLTPRAMAAILRHCVGVPDRIERVLSASIAIGACRGTRLLTDEIVEDAIASLEPTTELPNPVLSRKTTTVSPVSTADRPTVPPREPAAPPMLAATAAAASAGDLIVLRPALPIASPPAPPADLQIVVTPNNALRSIGPGWGWSARTAAAAVFVAAFGCIPSVRLGPEGRVTEVIVRSWLDGSALAGALADRAPEQARAQGPARPPENFPAGELDTAPLATATAMPAVVAPAIPNEAPVEWQSAAQATPLRVPVVAQSPTVDAAAPAVAAGPDAESTATTPGGGTDAPTLDPAAKPVSTQSRVAETVLAPSPAGLRVAPGPSADTIGSVFQQADPSEGMTAPSAISVSVPSSAPASESHMVGEPPAAVVSSAASGDATMAEAASLVAGAATVVAQPEPPPAAPRPDFVASARAQASLPSGSRPPDVPDTAPVAMAIAMATAMQAAATPGEAVMPAAQIHATPETEAAAEAAQLSVPAAAQSLTVDAGVVPAAAAHVTNPAADNDGGNAGPLSDGAPALSSMTATPETEPAQSPTVDAAVVPAPSAHVTDPAADNDGGHAGSLSDGAPAVSSMTATPETEPAAEAAQLSVPAAAQSLMVDAWVVPAAAAHVTDPAAGNDGGYAGLLSDGAPAVYSMTATPGSAGADTATVALAPVVAAKPDAEPLPTTLGSITDAPEVDPTAGPVPSPVPAPVASASDGMVLASSARRALPAQDAPPTSPAPAVTIAQVSVVGAAATPPVARPPAASPTSMPPSAAQLARLPATAPLSPEMVTALLRRGQTLLEQGDVSAARLLYKRAAAADSGPGATGAGKTYDPAILASINARGLQGDAARAADWYRKGVALGDSEAGERLKALTARTGP